MLRLYVYDNNGASTGIDCRFSCLANSLVQRSLLPPLSLSLSIYRALQKFPIMLLIVIALTLKALRVSKSIQMDMAKTE